MLTMPRGSFSGPFRRTSGAMISRFRRCLRSALGVRRSAKVAMVSTLQEAPRQGTPQKTSRAGSNRVFSHFLGDVSGDRLCEVGQWHHAEVLIATCAHRNSPVCLLLVAYDEDVRDLLQG